MRRLAILLLILSGVSSSPAVPPSPSVLTNCLQIRQAISDFPEKDIPFDITASAVSDRPKYSFDIAVWDSTGTVRLNSGDLPIPPNLRRGNVIHASGVVCRWRGGRVVTDCRTFDIVAPGEPPPVIPVSVAEILQGRITNAMVKVTGCVKDVFRDDIDHRFVFFSVADPTGILYASLVAENAGDDIFNLIGATVSITGLCSETPAESRPFQSQILNLNDLRQVTVITPPPHGPFDDPRLRHPPSTDQIGQLAQDRVLFHGQVAARWQDWFFLLKDGNGRVLTVESADKTLPSPGEFVDVVGTPSANFYQLHLLRAIWREASPAPSEPDLTAVKPVAMTVRELLTDESGMRKIKVTMHGQTIRITGEIRSTPSSSDLGERLFVQCGDFVAPVEVGDIRDSLRQLSPGCRVSVTGTCIMDISSTSAATPFPRVKGFFLVPRTEADIRIIRRPSWWTPIRLFGIIAILTLVLSGSLMLNVALHRLSAKKGRELAAESIALAESEIKAFERTRLAVELHDSIAQNLTGAAMEIRAANRSHEDGDGLVPEHLGIALKTVDSCRGELRNCIWDLRNQALEKADVDEAIRLTLQPILGTAQLTVRFNVPRALFSDHTIHAILCVIRELTINGIRHGHASSIRVAGAIENGHLLFSVRDDGCGFDPSAAPGVRNGHFGLQGIRERIRPYNGTIQITSEPGQGTRTSIDIKLPSNAES